MLKKLLLFLIIISGAYASTAAAFLDNGISARSDAMGRAFTSVANDLDAFYYNPAGYAEQNKIKINSMGTRMNNIYDVYYLGGGMPLWGGYGAINLFMSGLGDIPKTGYDGTYVVDDSESFEYASRALFFSYGFNAGKFWLGVENINFGVNLKLINEVLYENKSSGAGVDAGVIYTLDKLKIGFSVLNIIEPQMKWNTDSGQSDPVERREKLGASYLINDNLTLALDLTLQKYDNLIGLGAEYFVNQNFALRMGSFTNNFSFGLGFYFNNFNFDYAFIQPNETIVGNTHKISIGYVFGNGERIVNPIASIKGDSLGDKAYQLPTVQLKETVPSPAPQQKAVSAVQTTLNQIVQQNVSLVKKTFKQEDNKVKCYYRLKNPNQDPALLKYTIILLDDKDNVLAQEKNNLILSGQAEDLIMQVFSVKPDNKKYKVKAFININDKETLSFTDQI